MSDLDYTVDQHVATITLNRPDQRNAFTLPMINECADHLEAVARDDGVRAVVLTGAGGSFCSGVDLTAFGNQHRTPLEEKHYLMHNVHRVALALERLDKPVIAAVDGAAVGAGMDLALYCDVRFASPRARFSEAYIKVGLVPGNGGCWLLPRLVGRSTAMRLLWTGDFVDAATAAELGLVEYVVEDEPVLDHATAFARRVAAQPPIAVQTIKRAVRQGATQDLPTALDLISSHFAVITSMRDSREAFDAYTQKRAAVFEGC